MKAEIKTFTDGVKDHQRVEVTIPATEALALVADHTKCRLTQLLRQNAAREAGPLLEALAWKCVGSHIFFSEGDEFVVVYQEATPYTEDDNG